MVLRINKEDGCLTNFAVQICNVFVIFWTFRETLSINYNMSPDCPVGELGYLLLLRKCTKSPP